MLREVVLSSKIMNSFYFLPYSFSFLFCFYLGSLFYHEKNTYDLKISSNSPKINNTNLIPQIFEYLFSNILLYAFRIQYTLGMKFILST